MRSVTCLLFLLLFSAVGCTSNSERAEPAERFGALEGTQTEKMRRVLSTIHDEARADPMPYFHLNTQRAEVLKQQMQAADSSEKAGRRYAYAQELLYAGQTKAAIRQLQRLIDEAGLSPHRLSPKEKPVFEQLALSYLRLGEQQNCL